MRENDAISDPQSTETNEVQFLHTVRFETGASFCCNVKRSRQRAPLQSSELYSPMPAQRENIAYFGRCEQFPTEMKVRAVDPRCLQKTIFRDFLRYFFVKIASWLPYMLINFPKLLPNDTKEARGALARAQILQKSGRPKCPTKSVFGCRQTTFFPARRGARQRASPPRSGGLRCGLWALRRPSF